MKQRDTHTDIGSTRPVGFASGKNLCLIDLVTVRVSKGYRAKRIRAKYFLPSVAGYSPAKKAKILYIENNILCG